MFEKVGQHAEEIATRLPRRAFFGKVAQAAVPLAAALGSYLALTSGPAAAIGPGSGGGTKCCWDRSTGAYCKTSLRFGHGHECSDFGLEEVKCSSVKKRLSFCEPKSG